MVDERKVWINGKLIPWDQATVHILSHGFSRGSAIFEVFGIHKTPQGPAAFRMDDHFKRFKKSAALLGMDLAYSEDEMKAAVAEAVQANNLQEGYIKAVAYYGEEAFATLVPNVPLDLSIFAISMEADLGLEIDKAISACLSKWRKLHASTVPPEAKAAANYLNGMLTRQDAQKRGFDVGLMLDTHGFLAEGSIEAVFLIKDGVLLTPALGRILPSISRRSILEIARASGIETIERAITPDELFSADEIFTSATPYKALPVGRIEDRILDAPGPVTRRLTEIIENVLKGSDDRFKAWFEPVG